MTYYYTLERSYNQVTAVNAGGKAREDVASILDSLGMKPLPIATIDGREDMSGISKVSAHRHAVVSWLESVQLLSAHDCLVIQFPPVNHSFYFPKVVKELRRRGIHIVLLIHDLDGIRPMLNERFPLLKKIRTNSEEVEAIRYADAIIVHNEHMAAAMVEHYGCDKGKLINLGIFDYLMPEPDASDIRTRLTLDAPIVVAGNLSVAKAAYINKLPSNCDFNLYGLGYNGPQNERIRYFGAFPPAELPSVLVGSFGLIWDGDTPDTCGGGTGQYLRINNPHKTSLYLASGMPVAVWEEAAIADFVRQHRCGICISRLADLEVKKRMSAEEYCEMQDEAMTIGRKLRSGEFTKAAIAKAMTLSDGM